MSNNNEKNDLLKVVFVQDDFADEKNKFTSNDFFKQMGKYKYWILGTTLVFGILSYLFTAFYINEQKSVISASFNINTNSIVIKKDTDGNVLSKKYITGESYFETSIISKENIEKVISNTKNENGENKYKDINVDELISNNAIKITYNNNNPLDLNISTTPKYFSSYEEAGNLIVDLAQSFIDTINSYTDKYTFVSSSLNLFTLPSYDIFDQAKLLTNTIEDFSNEYETLLTIYNNNDNKQSREDFLLKYNPNEIISTLYQNKYYDYVKGEEKYAINEVKSRAYRLKQQYKNNEALISSLQGLIQNASQTNSVDVQATITKIENLQKDNDDIFQRLITYGYTYNTNTWSTDSEAEKVVDSILYHLNNPTDQYYNDSQAYYANLEEIRNNLTTEQNKLNSLYKDTYKVTTNINFKDQSKYIIQKSAYNLLYTGIGLIAGFIISTCICVLYGYSQSKKSILVTNSNQVIDTNVLVETKNEEKDNLNNNDKK